MCLRWGQAFGFVIASCVPTVIITREIVLSAKIITITKESAGQRIDNFLMTALKGVPKTRLYRALRKGEVRVNKGRVQPTYRLQVADEVRVPPIRVAERELSVPSRALQEQLLQSILYEDADCIVLSKPAGLAVHGGSEIQIGLIESIRQMGARFQHADLVHRLDRETSGCLLIAKNRQALLRLQEQFYVSDIQKEYVLVVHGQWPKRRSVVTFPLRKMVRGGERVVVVDEAGGKPSETHFSVLKALQHYTVLQAQLITGRMHQIRVHAKAMGCPIVGDRKYGSTESDAVFRRAGGASRLFLHAKKISFLVNNGDRVVILSPLPGEFFQFTSE